MPKAPGLELLGVLCYTTAMLHLLIILVGARAILPLAHMASDLTGGLGDLLHHPGDGHQLSFVLEAPVGPVQHAHPDACDKTGVNSVTN